MDETRAREIIGDSITDDNGLFSLGWYLSWTKGDPMIKLDGDFSAEELEAIAWWVKNK